jgi:hypothetical protein
VSPVREGGGTPPGVGQVRYTSMSVEVIECIEGIESVTDRITERIMSSVEHGGSDEEQGLGYRTSEAVLVHHETRRLTDYLLQRDGYDYPHLHPHAFPHLNGQRYGHSGHDAPHSPRSTGALSPFLELHPRCMGSPT